MNRRTPIALTVLLCSASVVAEDPGRASKSIDAELHEAVQSKAPPASLRLRVEWRVDQRWTTGEIRGDGVGIFGGRTEFRMKPAEVQAILRDLEGLHFAALPLDLGEEEDAEKLQGRVVLTIRSRSKTVRELGEEPEAEHPLARFAKSVLKTMGDRARTGVSAESLADGLRKVARGSLDPAALEIGAIQRSPDSGAGSGWILRLRGRTVRSTAGAGATGARRLELSEADWKALLALLESADPARFPQNLWAGDYRELTVRVLERSCDVVARPYLGVGSETHGAVQKTFDALWSRIAELAAKSRREGADEPGETDENDGAPAGPGS